MKLKEYVQTDDFLSQPLDQRQQWLSKQKGWEALPPETQRQYLTGMGKNDYKPRDFTSRALGVGLPLAGQYGGEALGEAAALGLSPMTGGASIAASPLAVAAGGGAGATAGSTIADFVDAMRGMGPKPTFKGELKAAPRRMAFGAAGSAMGQAAPRLVMRGKEGIAGALEAIAGNPRMYTRALLEGRTKGVSGSTADIEQAAGAGEHAVAEYEAKAQNKIVDLKKEMATHWRKQKYGDPLKDEFENPGPEPKPEQFKSIKEFQAAYLDWSHKANPPTPTSSSLSSIYNRFMKLVRNRDKMSAQEEVPELVRVKRLAQSKINFDKLNTNAEQKLTDDDFRRIGKITHEADKRIAEIDPKQKDMELRLSKAYEELESRRSKSSVKALGGRGYPGRFQERVGADITRAPRTITGQSKSPAGERTMGELRDIGKDTGTKFLDPLVNNLAKNYYSKVMPQGRQPWMRRMAIAAPIMLGTAMGTGKLSPYWASMLPLLAMMSPKMASEMLTSGAKYGPQALSQMSRAMTEKDPE